MNCNPPEAPPNHVRMCGYWRAPESPQVALAFPYRQISCVSHHRFVTTARLHAFVSLSGCVSLPVPVDFSGGSKKSDAAFSKVQMGEPLPRRAKLNVAHLPGRPTSAPATLRARGTGVKQICTSRGTSRRPLIAATYRTRRPRAHPLAHRPSHEWPSASDPARRVTGWAPRARPAPSPPPDSANTSDVLAARVLPTSCQARPRGDPRDIGRSSIRSGSGTGRWPRGAPHRPPPPGSMIVC